MIGYTFEELKETGFQRITPERWLEIEAEVLGSFFEKRHATYEKEYIRKDGTIFPVSMTAWLTKDDKMGVFIEDITERKQAEEALRKANETLQLLFMRSPVAIVSVDREGRVTMWNPALP